VTPSECEWTSKGHTALSRPSFLMHCTTTCFIIIFGKLYTRMSWQISCCVTVIVSTDAASLVTCTTAGDLAQNRPLWRMMSTYGSTQSWVACQKRWRRRPQECVVPQMVFWTGMEVPSTFHGSLLHKCRVDGWPCQSYCQNPQYFWPCMPLLL